MNIRPSRNLVTIVLGSIVVLAWIVLWWLEQSPYGSIFHNHNGGSGHDHHGQMPSWLLSVAFLVGWLLMTIAMMLPTTVPLINLFSRMVAPRDQARLLVLLLLSGYLTAWLLFGVAALGLIWGIEQVQTSRVLPQVTQVWVWSAGLFLLAGTFQFSKLKYACLDMCRTPLGFILSHWHGRSERTEAFNIGWRHGLFCVGCCWALMLLMFAVSTTSLGWMLLLALVMAIEKNAPWGRRLSRPLGLVLILTAIGIWVYHLSNGSVSILFSTNVSG